MAMNMNKKLRNNINVLQCNLQKSRQAQFEANRKVGRFNKDKEQFICLIQEPYVGKEKIALQPTSCKKYMVGKKPRTAIYTDSNTAGWIVEDLSDSDMTVIYVKLCNHDTLIVSGYMDIKYKGVITNRMKEIVEYADRKKWGLIMGIDSNCHSILYGLETNQRGEKLEEFIAEANLIIENIGREPTYESRGRQTRIDITVSRDLKLGIKNWRVDRDYNGSDHNTILFEIEQDVVYLPKKWKWHKADWELFGQELSSFKSTLKGNIKDEDCEVELEHIYSCIGKAMKKAIPKSKPTIVDRNNPWWSKLLKEERHKMGKLYKTQLKSPTPVNINKFKDAQKKYKTMCETARKKSWRQFQQSIDNIKDMNNFRKIIETNNMPTLGTLTNDSGGITDPGEETLDFLLNKHYPESVPLKVTTYTTDTVKKEHVKEWEPDWITEEKLIAAFDGFKNKKSPGTDELSPIVLKYLPLNMIRALIMLYKCIIKLHFTPTKWKESKLIFIPKPGKDSYRAYKSWRGISLSNYLLKALEKLCCWHMDENIARNPLHVRQHGFRNDRNTDTALSNVVNYIESYINNEQYVLAVFLDIQAAFDTIDSNKIYTELVNYEADKDMAKWYLNYIKHRNLHLEVNNVKKAITTGTGFPQGGVCSAKFWIIAFNEAIEIINTHGAYGTGFADDCAALIGGTNLHQMMSRMQKVVYKVEEWGSKYGLTFNALKTEVIVFNKATPKTIDFPNKLIIGDERVQFSERAKYLGINLDHKLNWSYHIEQKIGKAKQTLFMLRKATSKKWGPRPIYMKWMYNSVVKPRLMYGCPVWAPLLKKKTWAEKVNKINHLAVSMIANTRRTTPRLALEVLYDLPPLDLITKYEGLAAVARNKHIMIDNERNARNTNGHLLYWLNTASSLGIRIDDTDAIKADLWDRKYIVNQNSFSNKGKPIHSQYTIYTDGSKTDDHVGSGYVIYHGNIEFAYNSVRLSDEMTVFQAEVAAIKLAVEYLIENFVSGTKFVKLFSDSQAALLALSNWKVKSKLVLETIEALNILGEKTYRLELSWIKAHNNYMGNERADELARNAIYNNIVLFNIAPPHSLFKSNLWTAIYDEWTTRWRNETTCRMTKLFYQTPHKGKAKALLRLSRKQSRRLIEVVTGQNNLHYIYNKVHKTELLCRFCEEEEETFDHLVKECPCFKTKREEILGKNAILPNNSWKIKDLLKFSYIKPIDKALRMLNDSDNTEDEEY